jgi:hypothetical protein
MGKTSSHFSMSPCGVRAVRPVGFGCISMRHPKDVDALATCPDCGTHILGFDTITEDDRQEWAEFLRTVSCSALHVQRYHPFEPSEPSE